MKETNVMIGGKLGRYEILDVLGRGGQSIAYKARDPKIDRIVAVKQILSKKSLPEKDRAEFLTRFMRESQAAGRLSHPNIATIYDVGGDEEGEPYIAMEYVDGSDLDELIRTEHPLSQARVLRLFVQLCGALDYAHDAGIVHRDIKPGNIMVTRGDRVKVVDFGIAKMDSSSLTQAGMVMGTPSYMSPEQIMGKALDRRSDIFSLGVVLYEALTGEKPFVGEHWTTVTFKIVNEPHGSVLDRNREPTLLPGFDPILDRALAKAPANRYQTCAELGDALNLLLQDERLGPISEIWHSATAAAMHTSHDAPVKAAPATTSLISEPAPDSARREHQNARTAITGASSTARVAATVAPSGRDNEVAEEPVREADPATRAESTSSPISPVPTPPAGWTFTISRVGPAANEHAPDFAPSPPSRGPAVSDASEADSPKATEPPTSPPRPDTKAHTANAPGVPARDDASATNAVRVAVVPLDATVGLPPESRAPTGPVSRRGRRALLAAAAAAIVVVVTFALLSRGFGDTAAELPDATATVESVKNGTPSAVAEPLRAAREALGQGLIMGRDGKDALHFVTEALALDPDNTEARALEADIRVRALQHVEDLRKQGKVNEVQETWDMLLEDFPGDVEIQAKHGSAQATRSRTLLAAELERSRSAGEKAFAAGDYAEASTQFGKLTRLDPRNASAFYLLGRSNVGRGATAEAERNLTRACELEPRNPTYAIQLSRVLEADKKLPRSLAYLEKGIQLGGDRENSAASLGAHASVLRFRIDLGELTPHAFRSRHVHRFVGRCDGKLIVTESGVSFLPDEQKDHAIQVGWEDIKRFAIRSERLEVELTGNRKQAYECSELDRLTRIADVVSKRR